jgi:hypothetical protein
MAYEHAPNKGSLFVKQKKTNPKQPDYEGTMNLDMSTVKAVNGMATIKLSGWKSKQSDGTTYLSLRVDTYVPTVVAKDTHPNEAGPLEEEIPF